MLLKLADWITYSVFGLSAESRIAESIHYFIYDSIKIILLLFIMIFLIGTLRTYISGEKIKRWLTGKRAGIGNVLASLLGAVTPFCSCSSIPIFMSFLEANIPLGIAFSFLITSPLINEYLVVLMLGFFGWKITLAYVVSGILIGVIAGLVLGKMRLEKHLAKDLISRKARLKDERFAGFVDRVRFGLNEAKSIVKKLWLWVLVGVAVGALIHNYIPESVIQNVITKTGFLTVPLAVIIGVPMYGSAVALVPVASALFGKGVPIGTVLAFAMAIAALSFPEAIILRRVMKLKLIGIFFGIVALAIIITGYLFNALQWVLV